jgi:hypothetical protein
MLIVQLTGIAARFEEMIECVILYLQDEDIEKAEGFRLTRKLQKLRKQIAKAFDQP